MKMSLCKTLNIYQSTGRGQKKGKRNSVSTVITFCLSLILAVCTVLKFSLPSLHFVSLSPFSLSPSVPLEKGNSEVYRQREARAARLASEIESSPQYRHRVNLENDEGKSEEDKYSAVVRDGNDRERGRESPRDRDRERGRDSPGASNRWEGMLVECLLGR